MADNLRPESLQRITTPELAKAFIDEQVPALQQQIGKKRFSSHFPAVLIHLL